MGPDQQGSSDALLRNVFTLDETCEESQTNHNINKPFHGGEMV
jgi:hypothetical protein